jgi:large subunit ribosomal protein L28
VRTFSIHVKSAPAVFIRRQPCYTNYLHAQHCWGSVCLMAKVCEICGRGPQFGHRISHAHNVTKRRWNLNLQTVHAVVNGAGKRVRVCTSCIRNGKILKAPLSKTSAA